MQLRLELSLGVDKWTLYSIRSLDPKFKTIKENILNRDDYTCRYCSFRAFENMNIVNANGNYQDNNLANMVTSCPFCTQCHFIETVGKHETGSGTIIFMPEITQNDLNGLCHSIFCAMAINAQSKDIASHTYDSLKLRAQPVEKYIGSGNSNPAFLGQMLIDTPAAYKSNTAARLLPNLRLLPSYDEFLPIIKEWVKSSATRAMRTL